DGEARGVRDRPAARCALEAAGMTFPTRWVLGAQRQVSDLTRGARAARVQLAADDERAADAGAGGDKHEIAGSPSSPSDPLGVASEVGVVVDGNVAPDAP